MHILLVKTSSMGDVLHSLPALTDALTVIPTLRIDWVVEENFRQIPSWHPAVDHVIPVAIRRWRKSWFSSNTRQERDAFKQQIQQRHYDLVIDAQGLMKSAALITRLARGIKHGLDYRSAREPLASWFYHYCHHIDRQQHAVERIRQLFAQSLHYDKPQSDGNYAIAQRFLHTLSADAGQYLVFLHATTRANKHWPETHWSRLIELVQPTGLKIKLPWGAEHEYQRAIRLAASFPHVEVLPELQLQQIAEILVGAKAVVSVDTGLSHLTAALDRPNITLFGPTDPGLIGGYGKNQNAVLSEQKKMSTLSAATVMAKLEKIIL
ncbi:lipopolysaccharide heptosyltransferase RfaC [Candidatus Fukatsuia symbiotica]|uniref:Lipopolysaccharide heptosyltransferase 1 n=1 Tax=Candidatus Fukatsuia symbiotica TaxID=1878942 RepID=A0A2U8I5S0_9GAMM|nr:lipopolysaccharide heptosyltransferase RfaC [Candidatus Fukatsuia symbiotica]AWK14501.1 lipopolysaccharide heptosyltransferase 1 [Candidatus Fukatsuia symbiotica]MEA9444793.1 lipopolysaccharide heptosyltransferase RfaC [Candidatus Fukatsuia symbiotica]